jgi:hypothetical protein
MVTLPAIIAGAIIMGDWAIGLFFLRFWKRTHDRLFACFAVAFFLFGVERCVLLVLNTQADYYSCVYLIRLVAFLLIVYAIINKNRAGQRP